eukprot:EG_transcript_41798
MAGPTVLQSGPSSRCRPGPSVPPPSGPPTLPHVLQWREADVARWLRSLNLSRSYSRAVHRRRVTGRQILESPNAAWAALGMTCFGDLRTVQLELPKALLAGRTLPLPASAPVAPGGCYRG